MFTGDDWSDLPKMPRDALRARYVAVCRELAGLHSEMAMVASSERQAKVRGFHASNKETISARERDADLNALDLTVTVFDLRGQIEGAILERDLIRYLLDEDTENL